ncbi:MULTISPECIES: hypothetical protein [unclassified Streptomyces]|uniref:hypothetical protein n=1 Tax=unclassified Streptomyces TaxID=2593676 RepID=UPI0011B93C84|nr:MULTISPECIES: hypothetical protein [unclassified Streptomyces]MYT69862.1 hypothetical protein [Streptomyces sp. SID8367]
MFLADGAGTAGRLLVARFVLRGHRVTATTTSEDLVDTLARWGARGMVMDGRDAVSVGVTVSAARPDAIVHRMTARGAPGTDHLLAAAQAAGVPHIVAWASAPAPAHHLSDPEIAVLEAGGAVLPYSAHHGHLDAAVTATVRAVERRTAGLLRRAHEEGSR